MLAEWYVYLNCYTPSTLTEKGKIMKKYKNQDVIYIGLVLDDKSKEKLINMTSHMIPEEIPGVVSSYVKSCDHITIAYGNAVTDEHLKLIGMRVPEVHPCRVLIDDLCAGLFFWEKEFSSRGIAWVGSEGTKPHITLYYKKGLAPVLTGTISERNHTVLIADPTQTISGRIGAYVAIDSKNGKWIFE